MGANKQRALEATGWNFGVAADFLEMSDEECQLLDTRVELADIPRGISHCRAFSNCTKRARAPTENFRILPPEPLTVEMSDLVERLKRHESPAWAELYDRHIREIYGYVFHLLGRDATIAEDVAQETWMNALRGIERFDAATDQVRGWLFAIARSQVALHYRRTRLADVSAGESRPNSADLAGTAREPIDELQHLELVDIVRASLLELSEEYRELLLGKYVDRKSVSELATLRGKTNKAVEGLLSRARAELRSALAWYFQESSTETSLTGK